MRGLKHQAGGMILEGGTPRLGRDISKTLQPMDDTLTGQRCSETEQQEMKSRVWQRKPGRSKEPFERNIVHMTLTYYLPVYLGWIQKPAAKIRQAETIKRRAEVFALRWTWEKGKKDVYLSVYLLLFFSHDWIGDHKLRFPKLRLLFVKLMHNGEQVDRISKTKPNSRHQLSS